MKEKKEKVSGEGEGSKSTIEGREEKERKKKLTKEEYLKGLHHKKVQQPE